MTANQAAFVNMLDKSNPILNQIANVIQYGKPYDPGATRVNRVIQPVHYVSPNNDTEMDYHFRPTYR